MLTNFEKQVELFGEKRIVFFQLKTEEWEGFNERAATDHHFRSAVGKQIEGRELLKHPDRIGRAEHGHRTGQANLFGPGCGRGQDDGGRRVQKFLPMMFADAKDVKTDFVGQRDHLEQIPKMPRRFDYATGGAVDRCGNETIQSNFHLYSS